MRNSPSIRHSGHTRIRGSRRDGTALLIQAGDLWIQDLARSAFTRLAASDAVLNGFPIWTADGTRVVYKVSTALRVQAADGSGSRVIDGTTGFDFPASVTPDNETLIFMRSSEATSFDIYTVPLRGGQEPKPLLMTRAYEGGGRLSPDGRWLIYVSNESGQNEVYLRQFPGLIAGGRSLPREGLRPPGIRADGKSSTVPATRWSRSRCR